MAGILHNSSIRENTKQVPLNIDELILKNHELAHEISKVLELDIFN
jgi:hypothetical protein